MFRLTPDDSMIKFASILLAAITDSLERLRCNSPGLIVVFGGEDGRFYWIANPRAALAK